MTTSRHIIVLVGPTAGGKTAIAVALAQRLPGGGECIGADSMQIYRGMDLGTAKPSAAERAAVPHHLLDVADPHAEGFSVDRWLSLAEEAIGAVRRRGRWPVVVGGTNLYIQALLKGMDGGPPPNAALRRELGALDSAALQHRLRDVDPDAATRIHENDRKRAIRAIEVFEATGRPISDQQRRWPSPGERSDAIVIGLDYPPEVINPLINRRVREMVDEGLFEETQRLLEHGPLGPQAREALGYKQVIDCLEGRSTRDEAVEQIKIRTRRFAKQQRTWLRRFRRFERAIWLDAGELGPQELCEQALTAILRGVAADDEGGSAAERGLDRTPPPG